MALHHIIQLSVSHDPKEISHSHENEYNKSDGVKDKVSDDGRRPDTVMRYFGPVFHSHTHSR